MKTFILAAASLAALAAVPAQASTHVSLGFFAPAPVYQPAPVIYQPAPVAYAPAPVVYTPYAYSGYYYAPRPAYYQSYGYGHGHPHRWDRGPHGGYWR